MIDEKKLLEKLYQIRQCIAFAGTKTECMHIDAFIEFVKKCPKLPAFREWVPVSSGELPKETGEYLVWYDCGEDAEKGYEVTNFDEDMGMFGFWNDYYDPHTLGFLESEFTEFETVVAWQRLPEPYKGE